MRLSPTLQRTTVYAVFFLFFFQLLADFVEAIYAFGLLGTSIPPEIVAVLLFFSPLLLLLWRHGRPRHQLFILAALVLLSRVLEPFLDTRGRMFVAGLGVACSLLLFSAYLWRKRAASATDLAAGLTVALALSAALRTFGSGPDISTGGMFQGIGWGLALLALVLLTRGWPDREDHETPAAPPAAGRGATGPVLGLMAVIFLLYVVFSAPHVLARWTGVDQRLILFLYFLALAAFGWLMARPQGLPTLSRPAVLTLNLVFLLALALTARLQQPAFSAAPSAFPLLEPAIPWSFHIPLLLTLLLWPILLLDAVLLLQTIAQRQPSLPSLGRSFGLAAFLLLVLIFSHVFTTVYDYIPLIGPLFRNQFWAVHLAASVVLVLTLLQTARSQIAWTSTPVLAAALTLVGILALVGAQLITAKPAPPAGQARQLTILTYNIQQGYSEEGQRDPAGQLRLLAEVNADIIGLQESDNARIAGGNGDLVRYFANQLGMYAYYGPKTVAGTFGIALLSRYPIENARTYYQFSEGEQVAVIAAQITVGDRTFEVFVNHLGNGGPLIQQQQLLELMAGRANVIALGDFNFRPDSEQYRLTTQQLADSWLLRWPTWSDDQGQRPERKIDHIFVSTGTDVRQARFIPSPASDHPAVTATIGW